MLIVIGIPLLIIFLILLFGSGRTIRRLFMVLGIPLGLACLWYAFVVVSDNQYAQIKQAEARVQADAQEQRTREWETIQQDQIIAEQHRAKCPQQAPERDLVDECLVQRAGFDVYETSGLRMQYPAAWKLETVRNGDYWTGESIHPANDGTVKFTLWIGNQTRGLSDLPYQDIDLRSDFFDAVNAKKQQNAKLIETYLTPAIEKTVKHYTTDDLLRLRGLAPPVPPSTAPTRISAFFYVIISQIGNEVEFRLVMNKPDAQVPQWACKHIQIVASFPATKTKQVLPIIDAMARSLVLK